MRVAVTSSASDIEASVDGVFGRCAHFVIVDPDTMEWEAFSNEAARAGGGAGIQAAQFVVGKGVEAVITGNIGPNAFGVLSAAGVRAFCAPSGSVREAAEGYKAGVLTEMSSPNVGGHFGMGGGGRGRGRGRQW
jgi:predicted Fe-Mo cluster-binding NifX family protein